MRIFLATFLPFVLCADLHAADSATTAKPNILFLLSDDHSYPYLSTYGDSNVKTPVLDQLAADGIKFHRMFTGALPRDEVTILELLRDKAGYYTGICGRNYHLDGSAQSPAVAHVYDENKLKTFHDRVDFLHKSGDRQVAAMLDEFLAAKPADKPFFMWANFSDPHHVWDAPASYRPDPASLKLPGHWPDFPGVREQLADYCAEVNRLDETIGSVLVVLERLAVRSDRYKFIYNCTPWIPYGPVDSAGGEAWKQIRAAHAEGKLPPGLVATYFTTPRPIYELYDLDQDPDELQNLSGKAEVAAVEEELREKLAEKMILDQDYLPLPALLVTEGHSPSNPNDKAKQRKRGS